PTAPAPRNWQPINPDEHSSQKKARLGLRLSRTQPLRHSTLNRRVQLRNLVQRQLDAKARLLPVAPPVDLAAVGLRDLLGHDQAEADALGLAGDKRLKQLARNVRGRPLARIEHLDDAAFQVPAFHSYFDFTAGSRGLDRVGQHVEEQVPQPAGVAVYD